MEISLGYVTAYDPTRGTVDIRTQHGTQLVAIPFDSSLAMYATPVLPVVRTENGKSVLKKAGTFVLYTTINDSNIRILRTFNDDQAVVEPSPEGGFRIVKGTIADTLLFAIQDGELLLTAPGRITQNLDNTFERVAGAWALFKNSGELLLSNALSSCQIYFDDDGDLDIRSTSYSLTSPTTHVWTDTAGALNLSAGAEAKVALTKDGVASVSGGNSALTLQQDTLALASQNISFSAGASVVISTAAYRLVSDSVSVDSSTWSIDVTTGRIYAAGLELRAANSLALSGGVAASLRQGAGVVSVADDSVVLDSTKKVTIKVGDSVVTVSENGVDITSSKPITVNNGTAYAVTAAAPGPVNLAAINNGLIVATAAVKLPAV